MEVEKFVKKLVRMGVVYYELNCNFWKEGEGDNVVRGCSEWGGLIFVGVVYRW